jgi:carbohydrate diacid regulator
MLSNQKLQNSLNEIKEISRMDTALFTAKGKLVAHTEDMPLPEALEQQVVVDFAESLAEKQTYQDYHLYKVMVEGETEYILVCLVKEESFLVCAQMAVCQIRNLVMSFAEQFDRNNFMQNILLGNMLIVDIYGKAKKHHIQEVPRVVFVNTMKEEMDISPVWTIILLQISSQPLISWREVRVEVVIVTE